MTLEDIVSVIEDKGSALTYLNTLICQDMIKHNLSAVWEFLYNIPDNIRQLHVTIWKVSFTQTEHSHFAKWVLKWVLEAEGEVRYL